MTTRFSWPLRVYMEDTDAGGVVFYANHLRFMERARTEMMDAIGIDHAAMIHEDGLMFVVRHCTIDYMKPAHLGDNLTVLSWVSEIGNASLTVQQSVEKAGMEIAKAQIVLVCVKKTGQACRIPAAFIDKIRVYLEG